MTLEKAHEILHPNTTKEALTEIEYYAEFNTNARMKAVNEACMIACKAIEKQIGNMLL